LDKIKLQISEAKRRGVDIEFSKELLNQVDKAVKKGNEQAVTRIIDDINLQIKHAKQKRKYEMMIFNSGPVIEKAKRAGADVSAAEELLENARVSIENNLFGEAHQHIKNARLKAEDAKRYTSAKALIMRVVPVIESAKQKGVEISETTQITAEAWSALKDGNYGVVKGLMNKVNTAIEQAEEHRRYEDSIKEIEARLSSVQEAGLDVDKMQANLEEARSHLIKKDYVTVRKRVNSVRREIEKIILQREAGLSIRTIQQFVKETKKAGIKSGELENMLQKAAVAMDSGNFSEIQALELDAKQLAKNLKLFDKLSAGEIGIIDKDREESLILLVEQEIQDSKEIIETAKESGINTSRVEGLVEQTEKAMSESRFNVAVDTVKEIRELLGDEKGSFQDISLNQDIDAIQEKISEAKELGVDTAQSEEFINKIVDMVNSGDLEGAKNGINNVNMLIENRARQELGAKYPKLSIKFSETGFETQKWNKSLVTVTNTGYNVAKNIDLSFFGDVEVKDWQTIPAIYPGKSEVREIAMKSFKPGTVPMDIMVNYQRSFDKTKYQLNETQNINVENPGTFFIEDAFVIYNNGSLIAKETRRLKEEVDGDLFTSMLTALSQFINESFNLDEMIALNRLEFGQNTVMIEKGSNFFLAVTFLGDESIYLPFYIAEIVREIEEKFGEKLQDWNGDLAELEGIGKIVEKILLTRTEEEGNTLMKGSMLYPVLETIEKGVQIPEFESKLLELLSSVDEELSTGTFDDAAVHMDSVREIVDEAMLNIDTPEGEQRRIDNVMHDSVQMEIQAFSEILDSARNTGIDTIEEEELIQNAISHMDSGEFGNSRSLIGTAKNNLLKKRESQKSAGYQKRIAEIEENLAVASEIGVETAGLSKQFTDIKESLDKGMTPEVGQSIDGIDKLLNEATGSQMSGKYPKLAFEITNKEGYHANDWNRFHIKVENKGNTMARNIDVNFSGDLEIKGNRTLSKIAPNSSEELEVAIRPTTTGSLPLDVSASYQRYFDDVKYQLNDLKNIEVDNPGSYLVEDVFLIHNTGVLIAKETRRVVEEVDSDVFSAMLTAITDFVREAFSLSQKIGINRMEFGQDKILIERGKFIYLALAISGEESVYIPFYMTELIKEIEDEYGEILEDWTGEMKLLAGIDEHIKKIIFVKKDAETGVDILEPSILSPVLKRYTEGQLAPEAIQSVEEKLSRIPELLEKEGIEALDSLLPEVKGLIQTLSKIPVSGDGTGVSIDADDLKQRMYNLMIRSGRVEKDSALMDVRLKKYLEEVGKISDMVNEVRAKHSISPDVLLANVVFKHPEHQNWSEVVTNMKTLILEQINARDICLISPDSVWEGLTPNVELNEVLIRESYKHIAMKIIRVLQYMPADKIKFHGEQDSFTIGVEGQQVYISKAMVSISFSLPEGAIEERVGDGIVYLDTVVTEEMKTETAANEIIRNVLEMRKKLELDEETLIEVQIFTGDELAEGLENWTEEITKKTNAHQVEIPIDDPFENDEYYTFEIISDEEKIIVGIVPIEFEE